MLLTIGHIVGIIWKNLTVLGTAKHAITVSIGGSGIVRVVRNVNMEYQFHVRIVNHSYTNIERHHFDELIGIDVTLTINMMII